MITRCQGTRFRADGDLEHVRFAGPGGGTSQAVSGSLPRLRPEWTQIDFLRRGPTSGPYGGAQRNTYKDPETRRSDSGVRLSARRDKAEWPLPGLLVRVLRAAGLRLTATYASWANPIEAHSGPLRQFTLANPDHRSHPAQSGPCLSGVAQRPRPPPRRTRRTTQGKRTRPHPQREGHLLGRPQPERVGDPAVPGCGDQTAARLFAMTRSLPTPSGRRSPDSPVSVKPCRS